MASSELREEMDMAEEKLREELVKGGTIQKGFAGYYFDGINVDSTCATTESRELKSP